MAGLVHHQAKIRCFDSESLPGCRAGRAALFCFELFGMMTDDVQLGIGSGYSITLEIFDLTKEMPKE